jgi:DNA repair protein RadA/Sms
MASQSIQFRCVTCDAVAPKWVGRCPSCAAWNSLEEQPRKAAERPGRIPGKSPAPCDVPVRLSDIDSDAAEPIPTGIGELDRVLGGGIVPSSVTLLAGEPGIGKSTLVLQMLASCARKGVASLLVSAEESPEQVHRRARRLGLVEDGIWITSATGTEAIAAAVEKLQPGVTVVDSIQTVASPDVASPAGSVAQVRVVAQELAETARSAGSALVLIGHVTKEGSIAGPRVLEHLVDSVLSFEGDRHHSLRMLRAVKHRFGAVGEMAMWEMTSAGLGEVTDPARMMLADRHTGLPGSAIFVAMEGRRPLMVEVQALVASSPAGISRRAASGYDHGRLAQVLAVLERRVDLSFAGRDVYVSAAGGVRLDDPGADLAVAMALVSSLSSRVVDDRLVVVGEIGLGGELRSVTHTAIRLGEAARHGFTRAVTARGAEPVEGITLWTPATVSEALDRGLRNVSAPARLVAI